MLSPMRTYFYSRDLIVVKKLIIQRPHCEVEVKFLIHVNKCPKNFIVKLIVHARPIVSIDRYLDLLSDQFFGRVGFDHEST